MFGQTPRWRIFSVFKTPVFIEPWFLLLCAFFTFSGLSNMSELPSRLLIVPVLFIGILWHEIGHAIAIRRAGYGDSIIILQGFGGVTVNQRGYTPPGKGAFISVMGPIFSLSLTVVFGIAYYVYPNDDLFKEFLQLMAMLNAIWAVFNMLPINPLDGGHIMMYGLRKVMKNDRKAILTTAYISIGVLVVLAAIGTAAFDLGMYTWLIAIMIGFSNVQIIQRYSGKR